MEDANLIGGDELHSKENYVVYLNGQPVGVVREPWRFVRHFRLLRKRGRIQEFVSIYLNDQLNGIFIASDGGRLVRPLIIVENGVSKITQQHIHDLSLGLKDFTDFLREGLIEYLDVNEQINALIALNEDCIEPLTTHMEIEPFTILGIVSGLIPYPHHNQSPRNTYQCAMGKQAIGTIGLNQMNRADTLLYLMNYPQRPLVKSKTLEMINFENLPAGQNASVAIMSYSGYDIEDAVILNRASLDRGFARASVIRRNTSTLTKYHAFGGLTDQIQKPPSILPHQVGRVNPLKFKRFEALGDDGLADIGKKMFNGDVWVNKHTPVISEEMRGQMLINTAAVQYKSQPETYKGVNPAYVDRVILTTTPDEPFLIKMIQRQTRVPEVGDKFSSRHG